MLTTIDFYIHPISRDQFSLEVFKRGNPNALAQTTFGYDISYITDFEIRRLVVDRRDSYSRLERLEEFGRKLHNMLFCDKIKELWQKYKTEAEFLELCLRIAPEADDLETLPWETLYDGQEYLAAGTKTGLSRLPTDINIYERLPELQPPLKMLAFIASPLDLKDHERLNIEREQEILIQAVNSPASQGKLKLVCEDEAKLLILEDALEEDYHIFHYSGHGIPPEDGGGLLLEDTEGKRRPTNSIELLQAMQKSRRDLQLVVLSGCQTARTLNTTGFQDLARSLMRRKIPVVIAMQFSITDEAGLNFAKNLYPRLVKRKTIVQAVSACRRALLQNENPQIKADAFSPVLLSAVNCATLLKVADTPRAIAQPIIDFSFHPPLPLLGSGFYGRRKEYRTIRDALTHKNLRAIIIHGIGGIGKTAIASHIAERLKKKFKGVYTFNCSGNSIAPETILLALHRYFVRQRVNALQSLVYQPIPPEQMACLLAQVLCKWPLLIIFDNFETHLRHDTANGHEISDKNLREFLTTLIKATTSGSRFLFTSRYLFDVDKNQLGLVQALPLHDLSRPETLGLMQKLPNLSSAFYGDKVRLFENFGGHPHALVTLDRYCGHMPLSKVIQDASEVQAELHEFLAIELSYAKLSKRSRLLLNGLAVFREPVSYATAEWVLGEKIDLTTESLKYMHDWEEVSEKRQNMEDIALFLRLFDQRIREQRYTADIGKPVAELIDWGLLSLLEAEGNARALIVHSLVRNFCRDRIPQEIWIEKLLDAAAYYMNQTKMLQRDDKTLASVQADLEAFGLLIEACAYNHAANLLLNIHPLLDRWGFGGLLESKYELIINKVDKFFQGRIFHNYGLLRNDRGDHEAAFEKLVKALKIDEELGDLKGFGTTLHDIGLIHLSKGDSVAAFEHFEKALGIAEELGDHTGQALSLHQIGTIHFYRGDYEVALENYEKALKISEELGDLTKMAAALHQIGITYYRLRRCKDAIVVLETALKIKEEIDDSAGIARSLHAIGNSYYFLQEYEAALNFYEKALEMFEDIDDRRGIARLLGQIGNIYIKRENYRDSFNFYKKSLNMFEQLREPRELANSLSSIANLHFETGNHEEALNCYDKALKIKEEIGDNRDIAILVRSIAMVHLYTGEIETAFKEYEKAIKISKEVNDHYALALSNSDLGNFFLLANEFSEAFDRLIVAYSILSEMQTPDVITVLNDLKNLREKWGEKKFDAAWREKTGQEVAEFLK